MDSRFRGDDVTCVGRAPESLRGMTIRPESTQASNRTCTAMKWRRECQEKGAFASIHPGSLAFAN